MTLATVRLEHHDGMPVVFLDGDVDAANADRVGDDLALAVTNRDAALIVVLSDARYFDSAGINLLFRLHEQLWSRRQRFGLVLGPSARLRKVLELSGVLTTIPVWEELEAALAGIRIDE
ncbi:MAG TPA: STAS domain-containing protein [Solirubrobacteraceae bacterium]|jgi:anti-anti-sigma factor|nr:STAS domain-containing protein [Solirubrobacteraceae bacterium]